MSRWVFYAVSVACHSLLLVGFGEVRQDSPPAQKPVRVALWVGGPGAAEPSPASAPKPAPAPRPTPEKPKSRAPIPAPKPSAAPAPPPASKVAKTSSPQTLAQTVAEAISPDGQGAPPAETGPGDTTPIPGDTLRQEALAVYLAKVRQAVLSNKRYPYSARRMGLEGMVRIRIGIDAQGQVTQTLVATEADTELFESAALQAVHRAAPFPALPKALGRHLAIEIPIHFQMEEEG